MDGCGFGTVRDGWVLIQWRCEGWMGVVLEL